MAPKRGEEDDVVPGMGCIQSRARCLGPRDGSKPMAPIGLPNVPAVSDTSNLARSTILGV